MKKYRKRLEGLPISTERIKGKGADAKGSLDSMQAATPRGRVERVRPLAEKFGLTDLLTRAESLIDPAGRMMDRQTFNDTLELILSRAGRSVNQSEVFPLADQVITIRAERSGGGKKSYGMTEEQRKARNTAIQNEINRLCLERGQSFSRACEMVSKDQNLAWKFNSEGDITGLDHEYIKKHIAKNPKN